MVRRLSPVNAHNLGLSLGEIPRISAKALKGPTAADEGITFKSITLIKLLFYSISLSSKAIDL
jgi:hypothetical protein